MTDHLLPHPTGTTSDHPAAGPDRPTRPRRRWARRAVAGAATLGLVAAGSLAPAGAGTWDYTCTSALTTTAERNTVVGTAPATVVQGATFELSDVVLSGTPGIDLLLVTLSLSLEAPVGAEPLDGLTRTWDGPGSLDPPGPYAPAGSTNASPATSFAFRATGPAGSTIELWPGDVTTTVADIADPSLRLDVACERTGGEPLAVVRIVAPTTTTTTGAGVAGAGVEAAGAGGDGTTTTTAAPAADAVTARPSLTG